MSDFYAPQYDHSAAKNKIEAERQRVLAEKRIDLFQMTMWGMCYTVVCGLALAVGGFMLAEHKATVNKNKQKQERLETEARAQAAYEVTHPAMIQSARLTYVPGLVEKLKAGSAKIFVDTTLQKTIPWDTKVEVLTRDGKLPDGTVTVRILQNNGLSWDIGTVDSRFLRLSEDKGRFFLEQIKEKDKVVLRGDVRVMVAAETKKLGLFTQKLNAGSIPYTLKKGTAVDVLEVSPQSMGLTRRVKVLLPPMDGLDKKKQNVAWVDLVDLEAWGNSTPKTYKIKKEEPSKPQKKTGVLSPVKPGKKDAKTIPANQKVMKTYKGPTV